MAAGSTPLISPSEPASVSQSPSLLGFHTNSSLARLISKFEVLGTRTTKEKNMASTPGSKSTAQSDLILPSNSDDRQGANDSFLRGEYGSSAPGSSSGATQGHLASSTRQSTYLPPSVLTITDDSRNSSIRSTLTAIHQPNHGNNHDNSTSAHSRNLKQSQQEPSTRRETYFPPSALTVTDSSRDSSISSRYVCTEHQPLAERRKVFEADETASSELMHSESASEAKKHTGAPISARNSIDTTSRAVGAAPSSQGRQEATYSIPSRRIVVKTQQDQKMMDSNYELKNHVSGRETFGLPPFLVSRDPRHKHQAEGTPINRNSTRESFADKRHSVSIPPTPPPHIHLPRGAPPIPPPHRHLPRRAPPTPPPHIYLPGRAPVLPFSEQLKPGSDSNTQKDPKKSLPYSSNPQLTKLNHGNESRLNLGSPVLRDAQDQPSATQCQPKENTRGLHAMRSSIVAPSRKNENSTGTRTGTRVSNLRKLFDPPKNTPPRVLVKKHRGTTPRTNTATPERAPLLQQRGSISGFDGTQASPLKDRIGHFESLNVRNGEPSDASTPTENMNLSQNRLPARGHERKMLGTRSQNAKTTLRRFSPWRNTPPDNGANETKDAWWVTRNIRVIKKPPRTQLPPAMTLEGDDSAKLHQGTSNIPSFLSARWVLKNRGSSLESEGGVKPSNTNHGPLSSISTSKLNTRQSGANRAPAASENLGMRPSSDSAPAKKTDKTGLYIKGRRRISRSGGPFVAGVNYELDQPRTIRASELKRLASLCKEKIRKVSGGTKE